MDTTVYNSACWVRMQDLPAGAFLENPVHRAGGLTAGPAITERMLRNRTELLLPAPMAFQKSTLQGHHFLFVLITSQILMTTVIMSMSYPEGSAPDGLGSCHSRMCPAQCLSWGELPAGCPLLWIWNYPPPFADCQSSCIFYQ